MDQREKETRVPIQEVTRLILEFQSMMTLQDFILGTESLVAFIAAVIVSNQGELLVGGLFATAGIIGVAAILYELRHEKAVIEQFSEKIK